MAEQESFISRMALAYGDEQNAALTFAFYNTLFFTLLGISLASIFAVYQMLYMFLHPILWAALVGTVLFPLKRMISANLAAWVSHLDAQDRPLLVGLAILPVQTLMTFSNYIYKTTFSFTGICIVICYCLLKFFCYYDALATLLKWIGNIYDRIDALIELFTMKWMFLFILLYTLGFGAWVYFQNLQQINKKFARVMSLPIWLLILTHISNFISPLRVLVFAFICSMLALISAGIMDPKNGNNEKREEAKIEEKKEDDDKVKKGTKNNEANVSTATAILHSSAVDDDNRLDQALTSDTNLRIISSLCAILFVVNHNSLLLFFFILPFMLAFFVDIGERIGLIEIVWNFLLSTKQMMADKSSKFIHIIVAGPLRKFVHLIFTSDRIFINGLSSRVDLISSICVMSALAIGILFFALFTAFQLHNETVHLFKLGGNILSSNPDWLKYAMNYTEGHLGEHDLNNYMQQAYQQGRSWLASNIRSLADSKDQARADQLEEQAKLLVDNLYRFWEERGHRAFEEPIMSAADNALAKQQTMEDDFEMEKRGGNKKWFSRLLQDTNLGLWKREFRALVQENLEMVWTIAQSIWHVLLMNINILSAILIAIVGFILGFGFELLNFLIECIVFLTTVYYLLANSTDQWLPLDWVNNFATSLQIHRLALANEGHRIDVAKAIERAISGVFLLTAKMSIFYGLYTYFIHTLFTLNVMFLPSMLAAIFAAIPIFPPYTVSLFGIIELWLVRGEPIAAILLALTSIAPLFFADPVFYREVKGSHPYITGLAVVGGIYWLGLQGAIIGPIILCLMIALLNLYAEFANHRPTSNSRTL